jgi:type II secretory pathway pseudopilin PulG
VGWDTTIDIRHAPGGVIRRAFSLIEILVIVLVLGVVAALAAPQFAGATEDERTGRAETVIAGVREAIAAFARRSEAQNAPPFPSIKELTTPGVVLRDPVPANPFNGSARVQPVSRPQADRRAVVGSSAGWNYFVDNSIDPPLVVFYANSNDSTTAPDGAGGTLTANEL